MERKIHLSKNIIAELFRQGEKTEILKGLPRDAVFIDWSYNSFYQRFELTFKSKSFTFETPDPLDIIVKSLE